MKKDWIVCVSLALATAVLPQGTLQAAPVTLSGLLKEMTDLEGLAAMPATAYTCKQFSSYDRRSTDANVPTEDNWFANGDRGKYLREEQRNGATEYVLMDTDGPGAIVRFWSANPADAGIVRVYIDGTDSPTFEASLEEYLSGKHPLAPAPIGHTVSAGWNSYLPMPYAKHCKVTTSKKDFYYHINYRTYAPGTEVESFTLAGAEALKDSVTAVARALNEPSAAAKMPSGATSADIINKPLGAGASSSREIKVDASAAVYAITCKASATDLESALRQCVLEVTFDSHKQPDIAAPLGDFFGTAPGINAFQSLPCGVGGDGLLYSHWVMPFQRTAAFRVLNYSAKQEVALELKATVAPHAWTADSLYFHAKWRAARDLATRPMSDWNYLDAKGRGRYVGNMLHVTNPVPQWWGEGDEKIYVDGEKFPSHFGTGSEDYYGYAWCSPALFTHAYHNQPRCDGPANLGQTCVSRFHILDNIPFTAAFRFDIEVWHSANCKVAQSTVNYWYADGAQTDNFPAIDPAWLTIPPYTPPEFVKGALEGEKMRYISCSGGKPGVQTAAEFGWSGAAQFWWRDSKPGDRLELGFEVPEAGEYKIVGVLTEAPDYGIAKLAVNGEPLGKPVDYYSPKVNATKPTVLGVASLRKGENVLTVEITGSNPKCDPDRHLFGLDYLLLKPAN